MDHGFELVVSTVYQYGVSERCIRTDGVVPYKRICAVIPVNLKMLNAFRIRTDL